MAGLAFAFRGPAPDRLHFAWPVAAGVRARLRNPRYVWTPLPPPVIEPRGVLRNPRFTVPAVPFPGEIPPQNVRAGSTRLPWGQAVGRAASIRIPWNQTAPAARGAGPAWMDAGHQTTALRAPWRDVAPASRSPATAWRDAEIGRAHV